MEVLLEDRAGRGLGGACDRDAAGDEMDRDAKSGTI